MDVYIKYTPHFVVFAIRVAVSPRFLFCVFLAVDRLFNETFRNPAFWHHLYLYELASVFVFEGVEVLRLCNLAFTKHQQTLPGQPFGGTTSQGSVATPCHQSLSRETRSCSRNGTA